MSHNMTYFPSDPTNAMTEYNRWQSSPHSPCLVSRLLCIYPPIYILILIIRIHVRSIDNTVILILEILAWATAIYSHSPRA